MRGEQHALPALFHIIRQLMEKFCPDQRVQPTGGFIHQKQLRLMGKSQCQREFHPHSLGQLADLLRDSRRREVEEKMADMIATAKSLDISKEELWQMLEILFEEGASREA